MNLIIIYWRIIITRWALARSAASKWWQCASLDTTVQDMDIAKVDIYLCLFMVTRLPPQLKTGIWSNLNVADSYQKCEEVAQETCYNRPGVAPKREQVISLSLFAPWLIHIVISILIDIAVIFSTFLLCSMMACRCQWVCRLQEWNARLKSFLCPQFSAKRSLNKSKLKSNICMYIKSIIYMYWLRSS